MGASQSVFRELSARAKVSTSTRTVCAAPRACAVGRRLHLDRALHQRLCRDTKAKDFRSVENGSLPTTTRAMATLKWCAVQRSTRASNVCVSRACDLFFRASRSPPPSNLLSGCNYSGAVARGRCGLRFRQISADSDATQSLSVSSSAPFGAR